MTVKQVYIVVGTRPNFIKVTQFKKAAEAYKNIQIKIIHTGQHYDAKMADVFFDQFELVPDYFLNIPPGSPNSQTAEIMLRLEKLVGENGVPNLLMVVGDVNSTLAAALAGYKLNIPVAHLESGLRSFDRTMPEEINRILTDEISDYFFVTEQSGMDNLAKEGKPKDNIFFVGNTMIDTLVAFKNKIDQCTITGELGITEQPFALMTMHRPATVDNKAGLTQLLSIIENITGHYKLVFPIHPRTLKNLSDFGLIDLFTANKNIITTPPLDYFSFQKLIASAGFVITDSGGIQEETTFIQKPCLTLRPNTERPVTCTSGTNTLVPFDAASIAGFITTIRNGQYKTGEIPCLWDGNSSGRIVKILADIL
ncbi:UDP-N-acetylglucosamine 2-epimerase (non-hydrolyzing) [Agriterribacter sp.]|uniref:non-hydrolyzing UDP-N-acetylglucosamine 2-epimerase n=1 Tax=Agriterribacter sp. TaxID=2821509 RepID=UPI002C28B707|nr:UDP-N-acetylglucosamine 2-epimerase (non-hydrolyzing) [Agriterribacter sp.]HRO44586.1 UDP-N-acetylglucosamine 2-epimerase (non-hydrolyzing) [Agriterribacter sp.]HRQ16023.1 UDP-N-acetylglucosamine 2-epimerase (non-hydrolyzing) [Agriterribacter sp.]